MRPLTEKQVEYAGNDVAKLVPLHNVLLEKVKAAGNLDCYEEEMALRGQPGYYDELPTREVWHRVSRPPFVHFTRQDLAVLCELAAWRETVSRTEDIPRNAVFRDEWLVQAAVKHPYTKDDVMKLPGIWMKIAKARGDAVAEIVKTAMKMLPSEWPDMKLELYDSRIMKQRYGRVAALIDKRAEARGIDPLLLGGNSAIKEFLLAANTPGKLSGARLMNGWKHQLLGVAIDDIAEEFSKKRV